MGQGALFSNTEGGDFCLTLGREVMVLFCKITIESSFALAFQSHTEQYGPDFLSHLDESCLEVCLFTCVYAGHCFVSITSAHSLSALHKALNLHEC